eukprot:375734-Prymnesium_polylepis.1
MCAIENSAHVTTAGLRGYSSASLVGVFSTESETPPPGPAPALWAPGLGAGAWPWAGRTSRQAAPSPVQRSTVFIIRLVFVHCSALKYIVYDSRMPMRAYTL